jgi:hypothetical protein
VTVRRWAESKLPSGPPAGRGISLDPDAAGTKTFAQPEPSERGPGADDESIYRVEDADHLTKHQTTPDEIDHSRASPSYNGLGPSDTPKTKYPYRDGIPNAHNASLVFVAERYLLRGAPERVVFAGARTAATIDDMMRGLNPKTLARASACNVILKRADAGNLRWILSVDCGNGAKAVRLKAIRPKANVVRVSAMDVSASCSCPGWRWLGPEHHASRGGYLDGKAVGSATPPDVRDPSGQNLVCKHVAAALAVARGWTVSKKG